ncbi:MAG TPA: hypothetical protein DCP87_00985 [Lactobacillus sp.]|nr:hypothetical protein [Lactobacillus sp.]
MTKLPAQANDPGRELFYQWLSFVRKHTITTLRKGSKGIDSLAAVVAENYDDYKKCTILYTQTL